MGMTLDEKTDTMTARGRVTPYFMDIRTGERIPWERRHNTISYAAAESMAAAFAGDESYIPNRIGIVYGSNTTPNWPTIGRDQSWDEFVGQMSSRSADVQIQPFSCTPTLSDVMRGDDTSSSSDDEPGKAVTFHMHTDSTTPGYRSSTSFFTSQRIYQAVLLNKRGSDYRILARVSLARGSSYATKPASFEIALDWTVKFF